MSVWNLGDVVFTLTYETVRNASCGVQLRKNNQVLLVDAHYVGSQWVYSA